MKNTTMKFNLNFIRGIEFLSIEKQGNESDAKKMPLLTITSTIIEAYFPIIKGEIPNSVESMLEADSKIESIHFEKPHLWPNLNIVLDKFRLSANDLKTPKLINILEELNTKLEKDIGCTKTFLDEIRCLQYAVTNWLDPNNLSAKKQPHNINSISSKAMLTFQTRIMQSPPVPIFFTSTPSRSHESDNLFALAWAEIWYTMENEIKARCCPYCGLVFIPPKNNPRKATCQRPPCKTKYEIDRHGGLEAYREWERNRKKVPSKRLPGRPKKQKEGE